EISPEKKSDLYNALTTYLKVDTSSTVTPAYFAAKYFDIDTQDSYISHLEELNLPTASFTKDISHIESKLKFRKVNFSKNVKIIAPSEIFKNYVTIESIEGDRDESGAPQT